MIVLTVTEKTYKKDSNWRQASIDESRVLIASVDLEDDAVVPVREDVPGEWFFTRDFTMRLYAVHTDPERDTRDAEIDFAKLEALKDFRFYDAKELRYWFSDIKPGIYSLYLVWSELDRDEEQELEFIKVEKID